MTKLFVGGVPYSMTNQELQDLFSKFGVVTSAQIVMDRYTNQSKGFAFVEMSNDTEAESAIKDLDGSSIDGRRIGVSVARPREDRSSQGNNFRRGSNNFHRGSSRR